MIKAESGELKSDDTDELLQLILINGKRYEEIENNNSKSKQVKPHTVVEFDKHTINIDLREFNNVNLEEESFNKAQEELQKALLLGTFQLDTCLPRSIPTDEARKCFEGVAPHQRRPCWSE